MRYARELLEALHACHEAGVIHRDLKPANIHVDGDGRLRILDLGLARQVDRTVLTREGSRVGTPRYMPPEVVRGQAADRRSDLYQVGLVLHEMMTGQYAFPQPGMRELIAAIVQGELAPLPELSGPFGALAPALRDKLAAADPAARFETAAEAVAWMAASMAAPRPPSRSRRTRSVARPQASRRMPVGAGVALALVVSVLAIAGLRGRSGEAPVASASPAPPAVARASELEVDPGPASLGIRFRTDVAVRAVASLAGTPRTTAETAPASVHALRFAGLSPGQPVSLAVRDAGGASLASWSGALPSIGTARRALFDALAFTDEIEAQISRGLDREAHDLPTRTKLAEHWKQRLALALHRPALRSAIAHFADVEDAIGVDPSFHYEEECVLVSRRERLRTVQFWLLRDCGVDAGLPWMSVAQRMVRTLPPGAVPITGACFGDGGRGAGRKPIGLSTGIELELEEGRFHHSGGFLDSAKGRHEWTATDRPANGRWTRLWAACRLVSCGPCAKISVRWARDDGKNDELAYFWGASAGEVVDGYIPVDPRVLAVPGHLALAAIRRTNAMVSSDTVVDHVALYGTESRWDSCSNARRFDPGARVSSNRISPGKCR